MSRIVVCTGGLSSGGAERVLSILSTYLADAFDEVVYVMWLDSKSPDIFYKIDSRVKILKISKESNSHNVLKHIIWFRKYIKQNRPNVILSFMVMINLCVITALVGTKTNIFAAERNDPRFFGHNILLRQYINLLYRLDNVKGVLMQTINNKNYFRSKKILDKTSVIYNPVLINENMIGAALNTPKNKTIVSVGRLSAQKQQHILIKAFQLFSSTHPDFRLVIYGEGDKRQELENIIKSYDLESRVSLPGTTSDVLNKIKSANAFVMTSLYEGMSNSMIEAMCLGLPVISTRVSGAVDLIEDQKNGFLVDIGDYNSIANYMNQIAENQYLANNIGKEASKIYSSLSVDKTAHKWVEFLTKTK